MGNIGFYKNNKKIIENEYQEISYEDDLDVLIIQKNKKYGVASLDGKYIIEPKQDEITSRGIYLYVKNSNQNRVYDNQGNIIDMNFNRSIYKTSNPDYMISTILNNEITYYGIIDKNGNQLVEEKYRYIEFIFGNYFIAKNEDGNLGIINNNGKIILDMNYNSMQKLKGRNILQAITKDTNTSEIYLEDMQEIISMENANISIYDEYIIISNKNEKIYIENNGRINNDSESLKNITYPDRIGDYNKEHIYMEEVYYIK